MTYNIDFLAAALVFIILILIHASSHQTYVTTSNRFFLVFTLLGLADIGLDLSTSLLIEEPSAGMALTLKIMLTLFYLMQVLVPYIMFLYVETLYERHHEYSLFKSLYVRILSVPMLVMCVIVLANCATGMLFSVNADGVYVHGTFYAAMYLYAFAYDLIVAIKSLVFFKMLNRKKLLVIWEYMVILVICVGIQAVRPNLMLTGFGIALGNVILYLTLNNPSGFTDNLTGVLDIQSFQQWGLGKFGGKKDFHILTIDLYQLKQINSAFGVSYGNEVLLQVVQTLLEHLETRHIFRVSGNRFLLVAFSLQEYEATRDSILKLFKNNYQLHGESTRHHAVVCGLLHANQVTNGDELLSYVEYLVSLSPAISETILIQGNEETLKGYQYNQEVASFLQTAIEQDLFEVYYQPVYSLKEHRFITLEALSRLRHPKLGPISPDIFIQIAEKSGQINQIGLLQFRRICRFLSDHPVLTEKLKNVKINLSPAQLLRRDYGQLLLHIIDEYQLPTSFFQFEITETIATEYSEELRQAITAFAAAGIGLCLDDFGSGYANLNTVLRLPFTCIKMDRSLLTNITHDAKSASFYQSIASILKNQGYQIVSEGVEYKEEVELLEQWNVDMIQGYYFSKPLPEDQLLELIGGSAES